MSKTVKCFKVRFRNLGKRMKPVWLPYQKEYDNPVGYTPGIKSLQMSISEFITFLRTMMDCVNRLSWNPVYVYKYFNDGQHIRLRPWGDSIAIEFFAECQDGITSIRTEMIPEEKVASIDELVDQVMMLRVCEGIASFMCKGAYHTAYSKMRINEMPDSVRPYYLDDPWWSHAIYKELSQQIYEDIEEVTKMVSLKTCYLWYVFRLGKVHIDDPHWLDVLSYSIEPDQAHDIYTDDSSGVKPPLWMIPEDKVLEFFSEPFRREKLPKDLQQFVIDSAGDRFWKIPMGGVMNSCASLPY